MKLIFVLLASVFTAVRLAYAEPVTVERDTELRAAAKADAPVVAKVARGTAGEAVGRSGAWINVRTPLGVGWLFSFNVKFGGDGPSAAPGGDGAVLGRLASPRRVNVTSTIGIRGLEEADLREARYSAAQMRLLDEFAVSREAAEQGSTAQGLAPARIDYLDGGRR